MNSSFGSWLGSYLKLWEKTQIFSEKIHMEEAMRRAIDKANKDEETDLPGFRFHPTDEELVGFYLRRKVEGKPFKIELIAQLDIYKYDPWDLPVPKINYVEGKEYYFFCIRARKYRKSVRPNRVTATGFWKATGIDKNISSTTNECIGLKKCLVYYKGKAETCTKTDWMMHEFRLPPSWKSSDPKNIISHQEEDEDLTLCRIFKRDTSKRIYKPQLKKTSMKDSLGSENSDGNINSQDIANPLQIQVPDSAIHPQHKNRTSSVAQSSYSSSNSNIWSLHGDEFVRDNRKWDELSYVVDSASNPTVLFGYYS